MGNLDTHQVNFFVRDQLTSIVLTFSPVKFSVRRYWFCKWSDEFSQDKDIYQPHAGTNSPRKAIAVIKSHSRETSLNFLRFSKVSCGKRKTIEFQ